jgi:hypothetical protein
MRLKSWSLFSIVVESRIFSSRPTSDKSEVGKSTYLPRAFGHTKNSILCLGVFNVIINRASKLRVS